MTATAAAVITRRRMLPVTVGLRFVVKQNAVYVRCLNRPRNNSRLLYILQTASQDVSVLSFISELHCAPKSIPDIFDCNLKTNYHILIIFGKNIPDTTV